MNSLARINPLTGEGASFSDIIARSFYTAGLESPSDTPIVAAAGDALIDQASQVIGYLNELQGMIDALDGEARISAQSEFNALRPLALQGKLDLGAIRAMIQERADFSNLLRLETMRQEAEREAERERRRVRDQEWEEAVNDTRAMIDRAEREGRITAEEAENLRNGLQAIDVGQREINRLDDAIKDAPPGSDTSELEERRDAARARRDAEIYNFATMVAESDITPAPSTTPPSMPITTPTDRNTATVAAEPRSDASTIDFLMTLAGGAETPVVENNTASDNVARYEAALQNSRSADPEPDPLVADANAGDTVSPTIIPARAPESTVATTVAVKA